MDNPASLITDEELAADLAALAVEAMGWLPLGDCAGEKQKDTHFFC